jgi:hypothetical protein
MSRKQRGEVKDYAKRRFGREERSGLQNLTDSFLKKSQISMGTIKLLTMAVLTILTQKYLRNK